MIFGLGLMAQKIAERSYVNQDVGLRCWQVEICKLKADIEQD
jgi:hypothetical protein